MAMAMARLSMLDFNMSSLKLSYFVMIYLNSSSTVAFFYFIPFCISGFVRLCTKTVCFRSQFKHSMSEWQGSMPEENETVFKRFS